jgi:hypothetical protein
MTMLARGGVPMLALWATTQLLWGGAMIARIVRSRQNGQRQWEGLYFFLLAYWIAFLINGSFDVFLEGPMGGIWFWSIYGTGLAAIAIQGRADAASVPRRPAAAPAARGSIPAAPSHGVVAFAAPALSNRT